MNLIIVEDEPRLRNSLTYVIPWEEHGIEVIAVFEDGAEGLAGIERLKPDLVLFDIELPGMQGLEMAESAMQTNPQLKMVVLSGHGEFKFAQKAMELGIHKYLLKPAGEPEILSAICEAAKQLQSQRETQFRRMELERRWKENTPRLTESFMQNWIAGRYDAWEIEQRSEQLQLTIGPNDTFAIAVLDMDPLSEEESRFSVKDQQLLQFTLLCIVKELSSESPDFYVFHDHAGFTTLVFPCAAEEHERVTRIHASVARILALVKDCLKLTCSAGIGLPCPGHSIRRSHQQAMQALHERIIFGKDIVIPYSEQTGRAGAVGPVQQLERKLETALLSSDPEETARMLQQLYRCSIESSDSADSIMEQIISLKSLFIRCIQSKGWTVRDVVQEDYGHLPDMDLLQNKEQIHEWLYRTARRIFDYEAGQRHKSHHEFIRKAVKLVEERLHQEISLYAIAEELYVSSSYFSRLFKQEMGVPFSQYVMNRKMEYAREILLKGAKVYDVVLRTGFRDVSYFTKVFRKYWGITPGECKRK